MSLDFKPITIADRKIITDFTLVGGYQNCDFAFANMYSWRFLYESEYAVYEGFLFLRFFVEEKGHRHLAYMFPVCATTDTECVTEISDSVAGAINLIEKDAESKGYPLLILGVTVEIKAILNNLFPNSFTYIPERAYYDYIYLREDLAILKGKRFQAKRNHINRFKKLYDYEYIKLTPELVPDCMKLEQKWFDENNNTAEREDLTHERQSMCVAMRNYEELGLTGGAILVDGTIVAFSYGSPINNTTFGVHVEKADVNYDGIFSVINQEFTSHIPEQFIYINREEDLGITGLRQSKLSYNPVIILEKNAAVKRR